MSENINSQITKLRKRMNITQDELAKAVGVTNQSVSKWELGICCPDIQLLPVLAKFFGITIDELMGVSTSQETTLQSICNEIKTLFDNTPEEEHFHFAFILSALLHKCIVSKRVNDNSCTADIVELNKACKNWSTSICSEPQGETAYIRNAILFTDHNYWKGMTSADIRNVVTTLKKHADQNILKVMFALYELTLNDFGLFVSVEDICDKCHLSESEVQSALENLDIQIKETDKGEYYRLHGAYMHIPPMLMMLGDKG